MSTARPKSPIEFNNLGQASWTTKAGDNYIVAGREVSGKRFTLTCRTWAHAKGINVYRGSKWLLRDGHRFLIERIYN